MNERLVYTTAYRILDRVTPLKIDCGQLCGAACCKDGGHDDAGMYLYPGESCMYAARPEWLSISQSAFTYGDSQAHALLAQCNGTCDRRMRPLSCRIFPLIPYKKVASPLTIIMDPRARAMCPLSQMLSIDKLDTKFVEAVSYVFHFLIKSKQVRAFIQEQSYLLDEYLRFLG